VPRAAHLVRERERAISACILCDATRQTNSDEWMSGRFSRVQSGWPRTLVWLRRYAAVGE
jgi:hypothetical protein